MDRPLHKNFLTWFWWKTRLCNRDIISHVQQVICFAFHDSKLLMETCQEAKEMRKIVTLFYLDWSYYSTSPSRREQIFFGKRKEAQMGPFCKCSYFCNCLFIVRLYEDVISEEVECEIHPVGILVFIDSYFAGYCQSNKWYYKATSSLWLHGLTEFFSSLL